MQKTDQLGTLTQEQSDLVFMCNNLGYYVSELEQDEDVYIKIRFNWKSKDRKDKFHTDGRQEFSGSMENVKTAIKEFSATANFIILKSSFLKD